MKNICLIALKPLFLCLLVSSLHAETVWQCVTRDNSNEEWQGSGSYKRSALNHSFEACKKASKNPQTCKTADSACESYIDGLPTRAMWQCKALDQMAVLWVSNPYEKAEDAALAAKAYCQEKSAVPATCYVNLLMCKNLNPLS